MKTNLLFSALLISSLFLALSCANDREEKANLPSANTPSIIGSWQINAIHWITKDTTYSIEEAQPGMMIIAPERYALMWTPTEEPRTPFKNLSEPTDDELKAGFRSVVFNGGTYEFTDSILTTTAAIAKVPGFEGGKQIYRYQITGDQMELTMFDERYPDGKRPQWYGRYETKFVMERLK